MGTKGKVVCIVAAVTAVLVVAALVAFSIFRWAVGNDAQDIQGTWYVAGTDVPVEITQDAIKLNDEVSYAYVVDAGAKTVAFSFGDLNGSGHYRFSLDRQQLAIMDGSFNGVDTFFGDLGWMPGALIQAAQGTQASPAGAADVTLLSRTPASA